MEAVIEKECSALGGLFQTVIGDMKSSYPIWEDFISKAGKLQSQLRATVFAAAAFLDAFQKVADLATNSRGGTRDIGSALTRMCMRHRGIETKLKQFSMTFADCLINPLQEQMEEWKRGVATLDKDHAKEYKRARNEIKKKSSDTLKLQKKAKKGRGDFQPQLDSAMQDVSDKYILLEETEKQALRRALIEERQRFCCFVAMLRPVVDEEISMLGEVTHLQTISDDLKALTSDPHTLPPASEQVIMDLKGSDYHWSFQTPPSSPNATMSRKSSMCSSSLNSVNSTDSRGSSSGSHSHSPSSSSSSSSSTSSSHNLLHNNHHTNNNHHHHHHRYRSSTLPLQAPPRLSSISSHDSGFTSSSHDQYAPSKSPSPMLAEAKSCPCSSSSEASEAPLPHGDCGGSPSSATASAHAAVPPHTPDKLTNGFDHYAPGAADSPYLAGRTGSLGSSSGAFPLLPPSPSTSSTSSASSSTTTCPSRSWLRPTSALLPDFPSYCTLSSSMLPSSRVPSWKDWAKPGPYDQPMVNTLRRRKDKDHPLGPVDPNAEGQRTSAPATPVSAPPTSAPAVGMAPGYPLDAAEELGCGPLGSCPQAGALEAHDELALALSRGLQLDAQRSSRDSMQCSSGYSTQSTTPCCSEDTIPSQVSDYDYFSMAGDQEPEAQQQPDFDKSSTIPRNSEISQSYRRMFQAKRPASTAGLPSTQAPYPAGQPMYPGGPYPAAAGLPSPQAPYPSGQPMYPGGPYPSTPVHSTAAAGGYPPTPTASCYSSQGYSGPSSYGGSYSASQGPQIITPGTATIRRTPSTKPAVRRCGSVPGTGPIHIRTPMVPALIPTVPDLPRLSPGRGGGEEAAAAAAAQASGERGEESSLSPPGRGREGLPVACWSGQAATNPPSYVSLGSPPPGGRPGEGAREEWDGEELMEGGAEEGGSMLAAIRKGVKLKRTPTDDRSAPRMA
ncbi:protein MTSS 1 isoform X1 [Gadus morhua]|uniref:Protein MTSS 1-like n=1 Tax=Gadus morhua TaxID=8049 RepID=A0A8C5CGB9_GADMO|nr:protein MTSS 1-like isoform X1 [Gadus morhua]